MNRIKQLREKDNLTLSELGQKVDLPKGTLSRYENGVRDPKPAMWVALANFFNVSVDYLKGYMICSRCCGVFIPESGTAREEIKCCPYCMNPYFVGDSFTESVDKFGKTVIAVRLSDKFNRICNLIKNRKLKENDESLEDTLLDTAGYAILGLKYLEEHSNETD